MKTSKSLSFLLFICLFLIHQSLSAIENSDSFVKGADVSWLPQMEATGYKFYNKSGALTDCMQILQDNGINTVRLRTFVNPSDNKTSGHCSKDETIAMALRAKNRGMRIMIDFHYSDTWADPAHQTKPAAWANHSFSELLNDVYNYTYDVLIGLKNAGITPDWVQVGNEIPSGMLYPEGKNDSPTGWNQLIQLTNKGYDAVKAVSSTTKVVLHVDQGNDNGRFRWWFDNATSRNAKYDVIGLSYYPYWLSGSPNYTLSIDNLAYNLKDMVTRYGKEVMVVEVGGLDIEPQNTYDMLVAVMTKVKEVPNNKGLGVIYWEPQGAKSWSGYSLSAWGSDGKPTKALEAFKDTFSEITVVNDNGTVIFSTKDNCINISCNVNESIKIFGLDGTLFHSIKTQTPTTKIHSQKGIYLIKIGETCYKVIV